MMWGYGYGLGWGGMLLMMLSMLFWFAVLGVLIWALVRWMTNYASPRGGGLVQRMSAREILEQRYARGEIDAATFDQMRERLEASQHTGQLLP
ncbi:MAG TPA: SHOCT domain-containing protein [Ktedonobacterales bacterium]|nr:SHOCT domain-containing protein [Ktedonobacterales bacterium]